jgi:ABC-2 type transport system ATP-binding protein
MSIRIDNITKYYGEQAALNKVSLEIQEGEIVGLLGPNGAGKSTLMKILTGFIPPSEGKASVRGIDVMEDPIQVKEKIGYLPEHNPLYLDMYVKEFLRFVGGIHKVDNLKERIDEIIELTGLTKESHKRISALSKGYRQRVGLAQAFIHNPEVLILDEPTSGLDPNQLVEVRNMIKEVGRSKTVLFSSHIMQEVEAVCDRIIIINQGELIADSPTSEVQKLWKGKNMISVEFAEEVDVKALSAIKGVDRVVSNDNKVLNIYQSGDEDIRADIYNYAKEGNYTLVGLNIKEITLEEVFHELTISQ